MPVSVVLTCTFCFYFLFFFAVHHFFQPHCPHLDKSRELSGCARLLPLGSMSNGLVQVSTQLNSNQINDDTMSAA